MKANSMSDQEQMPSVEDTDNPKKSTNVTFSGISKKLPKVEAAPASPESTAYQDAIKDRVAMESGEPATKPSSVLGSKTRKVEELDRTIYLNLPISVGQAIRNHATKQKEKVNQTILRAILEYMDRNNIKSQE
jgi:hypothetical protein